MRTPKQEPFATEQAAKAPQPAIWKIPSTKNRKAKQLEGNVQRMERVLRTQALAKEGIGEVLQLAQEGDTLSIYLLYMVAVLAIDGLDRLAREKPDLLRPIARNTFVWPGTISRKRAWKRANEELMDRLQLGQGSVYSRKGWQFSAPSTQAAFGLLIKHLGEQTWPNRALTKAAKRELFERLWEQELASGLVPENVEKLAALGKWKATKKPKYCKELHKATQDANVRAEIKDRIWDAFDNLVAG
jgi:hypothetical protein